MGFTLPELLGDLDLEPIGYPGIVVTCWVNATLDMDSWEPPMLPDKWDKPYYQMMARLFRRIVVPGRYRGDGQDWTKELGTRQAIWELEQEPGWEPRLLFNRLLPLYGKKRDELAIAEQKNS